MRAGETPVGAQLRSSMYEVGAADAVGVMGAIGAVDAEEEAGGGAAARCAGGSGVEAAVPRRGAEKFRREILPLPRSDADDDVRRRNCRGGDRPAEMAMAWLMGAFSKMARSRRLVASSSSRGTPVSSSTLSCSLRLMVSISGRSPTSVLRTALAMDPTPMEAFRPCSPSQKWWSWWSTSWSSTASFFFFSLMLFFSCSPGSRSATAPCIQPPAELRELWEP
mmetsp:Transcript_80238/g.194483  ORF Transcript_80238/g.194483 Transcript_80238/m.194483 type:complete len:222 (+) Transcript_80238:137-802(+)